MIASCCFAIVLLTQPTFQRLSRPPPPIVRDKVLPSSSTGARRNNCPSGCSVPSDYLPFRGSVATPRS